MISTCNCDVNTRITPFTFKEQIERYDGEEKAMLFAPDPDELYGDNGWVLCVKDVDKQHFIAHITAGNGIPPEVK